MLNIMPRFIVINLISILLGCFAYADISPEVLSKLNISEETTLITEPLLANGLPDYNTYLNNKYYLDPKINAAASLLTLLGRSEINSFTKQELQQLTTYIGYKNSVPTKGLCFYSHFEDQVIIQWDKLTRQIRGNKPVSIEQVQHLTNTSKIKHSLQWLATMRPCIAGFLALASFDHFYMPWISKKIYPQEHDILDGGAFASAVLALELDIAFLIANEQFNKAFEKTLKLYKVAQLLAQSDSQASYWKSRKLLKKSHTFLILLAENNTLTTQQKLLATKTLPPLNITRVITHFNMARVIYTLNNLPKNIADATPLLIEINNHYRSITQHLNQPLSSKHKWSLQQDRLNKVWHYVYQKNTTYSPVNTAIPDYFEELSIVIDTEIELLSLTKILNEKLKG